MNAIYAKIENMEGAIESFKNGCNPELLKKLETSVEELSNRFSKLSDIFNSSLESSSPNISTNTLLPEKINTLEKLVSELSVKVTDISTERLSSNSSVDNSLLTDKLTVLEQTVAELSVSSKTSCETANAASYAVASNAASTASDAAVDAAAALSASTSAVSSVTAVTALINDLTEKLNVLQQKVEELSANVSAIPDKSSDVLFKINNI